MCVYFTDNMGKIKISREGKGFISCEACDFLIRLYISYVKIGSSRWNWPMMLITIEFLLL
jgi:hypothetical protein